MVIRKLDAKERFEASFIARYCFHGDLSDMEKDREWIEKATNDQWGAFDDDGTLMAGLSSHALPFYIDGQLVNGGGIGGVSTLPEYRECGAVREIFKVLLPEAYRAGEVISGLFPFNHAFYRKMGYDTVVWQNQYEMSPAVLRGYRFDGKVHRWVSGESVRPYVDLCNAFAEQFNLAAPLKEEHVERHMNTSLAGRRFTYLFSIADQPVACITFSDLRHDPAAILNVNECAWSCPEGFNAILAFLGRFSADYGTVRLGLPSGIDLLRIIRTPDMYGITKTSKQDYMIRIINARQLLQTVRKPADCDVIIRVRDDIIAENNVTLHVTADKTEETASAPDLEADVRTLGQLATGAIRFEEAILKPDIRVTGKTAMLSRLFTEKPILITAHF